MSPRATREPIVPTRSSRERALEQMVRGSGSCSVRGQPAQLSQLADAPALPLPSGQVVATDPFHLSNTQPFSTKVPPGTYAVRAAVADGTIAGAIVVLRRALPQRWVLAVPRGV